MAIFVSLAEFRLLVTLLCLALFGRLAAQGAESLKSLDLEVVKSASIKNGSVTGDVSINRNISDNENALQSLQRSFGSVSSEVEVFRRKSSELNSRLEALGASNKDNRLIKLINELKVCSGEREKLRDALIGLIDVAGKYQKSLSNENPDTRDEIDGALKEASEVLKIDSNVMLINLPVATLLTESVVVSVKQELALIVANVGFRHGIHLGMPVDVVRNDAVVGTIRFIDVRDDISGALVQNLSRNETIKVGDRLKIVGR